MGNLQVNRGNYVQAGLNTAKAYYGLEELQGLNNVEPLFAMWRYAFCLLRLKKPEKAHTIFSKLLKSSNCFLGADHHKLRALTGLEDVALERGAYGDAEHLHRHVFELRRTKRGINDADTLGSLAKLTRVLLRRSTHRNTKLEAEEACRQLYALLVWRLGRVHRDTIAALSNIGLITQQHCRHEEAENIFLQKLSSSLYSLQSLGHTLKQLGRLQEAKDLLCLAWEIRKRVLGAEHPDTVDTLHCLAQTAEQLGKFEEAENFHRELLGMLEILLPPQNSEIINCVTGLARVLHGQGKDKDAILLQMARNLPLNPEKERSNFCIQIPTPPCIEVLYSTLQRTRGTG
ncbi:hypothetical protein B0T20DRAFT_490302 [Sordaria brevicollis]|uniref:Kinesin light chain n=1 Tax=Sordaria brevicollis TaxID=83679 RepID=A0AAE0NWM7_SORBR|nr:hypothetical protein B0T20DRAFT_490302 [Sordaria brevicollis]